MTTPAGAPPQYSADGRWWWDGYQWVPVPLPPPQHVPQQSAPYDGPYVGAYDGTYPAYPSGPVTPSPTDGKAIASLVLGIVWLGGIGSILAIVFGHLSRSGARKVPRRRSGLAVAGIVLGYVGIVGTALLIVGLVAASTAVKQEAKQVQRTFYQQEVRNQLVGASAAEETFFVDNETYTASMGDLQDYGFAPGIDTQIEIVSADDADYCLTAANVDGSDRMYYSGEGGFSEQACG